MNINCELNPYTGHCGGAFWFQGLHKVEKRGWGLYELSQRCHLRKAWTEGTSASPVFAHLHTSEQFNMCFCLFCSLTRAVAVGQQDHHSGNTRPPLPRSKYLCCSSSNRQLTLNKWWYTCKFCLYPSYSNKLGGWYERSTSHYLLYLFQVGGQCVQDPVVHRLTHSVEIKWCYWKPTESLDL